VKKKLKIGVVGGQIGEQHLQGFLDLPEMFDIVAVCDIDEAKAVRLAQKYNVPQAITDLSSLCALKELDVIDLCTPSYLHYSQIQQALAAGKYVICEKPVAGSLREIDELIRAEARSGKRVMPIFQYRFGQGVQKLKYLIEKGLAGQAYLTTVETAWRRREAYYTESGTGSGKGLGGSIALKLSTPMTCFGRPGPIKSVHAWPR
jgi:predicted dehydrogenase